MDSSNGSVPPGFRFHPTHDELLNYYLRTKVRLDKFDMEIIREVDLNKMEPWDLQERCKIGSTSQNEWYLFSHKDRKYPTGSRTNRATNAGFWKATGRDKCIRNSYKKIGMRKTLVFYRGRAPRGQKTDWIMHEYRLEDGDDPHPKNTENGWVVCRVFKKKNLFKLVGNDGSISPESNRPPTNSSANHFNRTLGLHRESHHYLVRPFHNLNHDTDQTPSGINKSDLGLNYPLITAPPHMLFHPQILAPNALKLHGGYHYTSPIMFKQLMMTSRDESSEGLEMGIFEVGGEQPMMDGREESLGLNEWAILDRLVTSHLGDEDASSKEVRFEDGNGYSGGQMNQPSLRGEMDF